MPDETQPQPPSEQTEPTIAAAHPQSETAALPTDTEKAADDLPEILATAEDSGTLKKKVTVTVPRARIDAKFNEMFGDLAKSALVPGFRIGHAPRRLIEKRFGKEVSQDVRNSLIGDSVGKALEKAGVAKTVGEPVIDLDKIALPEAGDLSYQFEVEVPPVFDLPETKGILVRRPKLEVREQHIEEYLEELRKTRAHFEVTDDPAAEGDVVVAGAKISGEGIGPLDRPGLTLRVAPGQVEGLPLVELGKVLSGRKAGETAALTVKVPEAHPNEAWRGKEATVEVAISQVRRRHVPEANEEFAKLLGFDSLEELRRYVAARLKQRLAEETQQSMRDQVCRHLLENTKLDLPPGVAARHAAQFLQRRYVDLLYRGVPRERIDENLAQLQAEASEQSQIALKLMFILSKVAEAREVEVGEDEINARIAQMASSGNRRPERLRQELETEGSLEQVELSIREDKALDLLLKDANVIEEDAGKPAEPKGGAEAQAESGGAGPPGSPTDHPAEPPK